MGARGAAKYYTGKGDRGIRIVAEGLRWGGWDAGYGKGRKKAARRGGAGGGVGRYESSYGTS